MNVSGFGLLKDFGICSSSRLGLYSQLPAVLLDGVDSILSHSPYHSLLIAPSSLYFFLYLLSST